MEHGLSRHEWERRFEAWIMAGLGMEVNGGRNPVVTAELESWPAEDDEWKTISPEEAAGENMAEWMGDEGGGDEISHS